MYQEKQLDMIVAIHKPGKSLNNKNETWDEELVWVFSDDHTVKSEVPVPLVVAPEGCIYRSTIIHTLNENNQAWRIVYTSTSYGGIRAAVMAGLGVTALARSTVPKGLKIIKSTKHFPVLPATSISLEYDRASTPRVLKHLIDYMLTQVKSNNLLNRSESLMDINVNTFA